ncbi:hypothetical protein EI94DRAFT_912115 [Lactarius quietus]|nr:hypothetical protein EI94DRAFT_912115 [Lactarius quietus]
MMVLRQLDVANLEGFSPTRRPHPAPHLQVLTQMNRLWKLFDNVDEDQSGHIDATELQNALINGDLSTFDLNTVTLLVNFFDRNKNGQISFNEFTGLWRYIKDMQGIFAEYDRDRSGTIDRSELQKALTRFGYTVTPGLLDNLQRKYGVNAQADQGNPPGISFDHFVRACVVLQHVDREFKVLDKDHNGFGVISYLQLLQIVMEAP